MPTKTGFKYGNPAADIGGVAVSWDYVRKNYPDLPESGRRGGFYTYGTNFNLTGKVNSLAWNQYSNIVYKKIFGHLNNLYAIRQDGTLWAVGTSNGLGMLGVGDTASRSTWTQVGSATTWVDIGIGVDGESMLGLRSDGTLWIWGQTQFGTNSAYGTYVTSPTQISGTWKSISYAKGGRAVYLINSSDVGHVMGYGFSGELGAPGGTYLYTPTQLSGSYNSNLKQIHFFDGAGYIKIDNNGNAYYYFSYSFTDNDILTNSGTIPLPNDTGNWESVHAEGNRNGTVFFGVKKDGTLWYYALSSQAPQPKTWVQVPNVRNIAYMPNSKTIVTRSGRIFLWSYTDYYNNYGVFQNPSASTGNSLGNFLLPNRTMKTKETVYYGGQEPNFGLIPEGRVLSYTQNSSGDFFIVLDTEDY